MKRNIASVTVATVLLMGNVPPAVQAQNTPEEYQRVLSYLNKTGDFKDNVLKVNVPRSDIHVTVAGVETPTAFGFGGWLAMTRGDQGMDVMMGDLVLMQEEVNPVMSAILDHGLEVTALHNHFFWEEPRIYYMHVHGDGNPMDLAHRVKPALDLIGHVSHLSGEFDTSARAGQHGVTATGNTLDTARLDRIIGHAGELIGSVYKVTVGRSDLVLKEMGATINSRMGLNTWAAFVGTDEKAAVAGDVAMLEGELNPVLRALRENGLDVVAIHHHMVDTRPTIIFLHYWGTGRAMKLASGFKAALDQLGKRESPQ